MTTSFALLQDRQFCHLSKLSIIQDHSKSEEQKGYTGDITYVLVAWHTFLAYHYYGKCNHPHHALSASSKYDEHQCPAGANAELTIARSQAPGSTAPPFLKRG